MSHRLRMLAFLASLCPLFFTSCSDDEDKVYPSIVTEMADLYTNQAGSITRFVLDNGKEYKISNTQSGFHARSLYRVLCGFVPNGNEATLYQLQGAYILRDSTQLAQRKDPTNIVSVWRTARYVNLHLASKTQGGTQHWGYLTDSIVCSPQADGDTLVHAFLSLYHNQNADPASYTDDVYASIPLDSIKPLKDKGETGKITLSVNTFAGTKTIEL